jgi:multidrug resistance protein, MATE family
MASLSKLIKSENIRCFVGRSWQVAWPMTLIMLFEFVIRLTDVVVAGRLGKNVQAAYGPVVTIYFIIVVVANFMTVGTVSLVSRLFGSHDKEGLNTAVFSALTATAVAGVVFVAVGIAGAPFFISIINMPEEVKPICVPLIRIYSAGLFFQYILITCNGIMRSCNMVKDSLMTMSVVSVLNVGLNLLFVFETPLGFRGIALATATAVFVGSLINLRFVIRRLTTGALVYSREIVARIVKIGWPMGALQILWQLGSMALYVILGALPENRVETIAGFTAGLQIESLVFLPAYAFNQANAVIVGNLLGENKQGEAYKSGLITASIGVCLIFVLVVIVVTNAWWITPLLSVDPIVAAESKKYLYIALISEPFMAWGVILGGALSGAGVTRSVMIRIAMSVWCVRLPLAYLGVAVFGFGAASVWWAMNISQFVQAFVLYRRYSRRDWLTVSGP